jgi:predicted kinase
MTGEKDAVLIVFAGLPGTGKTTVSRLLATRLGAVYLRIDTIEQTMKAAGVAEVGAGGYAVGNALAEANLRLGLHVVADCVNPVEASRAGWRDAAAAAAARLVDIQLVCSDVVEHRRRVEQRVADIPGLVVPRWEQVMARAMEARDDAHLVLDTAGVTPETLVERCLAYAGVSGSLGSAR